MRFVYRRRVANALWATVVGVPLVWIVVAAIVRAPQNPPWVVWSLPGFVVLGTVVIIRCLRREVVVDDAGITKRAVFWTWFVSWGAVRSMDFTNHNRVAVTRLGSEIFLRARVRPVRGDWTLEQACRSAASTGSDPTSSMPGYPEPQHDVLRIAFIASLLALFIGLPVWAVAVHDGHAYDRRAARERHAVAVVSDVWVKKTDDGEGDPEYSTFVAARLRLPPDRLYQIAVHRPDDVASDYDDEDPLPVVYDAAHPTDADFADRPTRQAQDNSVSLRKVTGPMFFFGGLVGVALVGRLMAHGWRRRFG